MSSTTPNILLITAHDLGTHLGCYGWDPALPSPNLDRFAAEGVRFANNFATAPFCSPSRGGITTGKYPHVNGLMGLENLGWDIPDNEFLATLLKKAGYETALCGFQHVAHDASRLGHDQIGASGYHGCRAVVPEAVKYLQQRAQQSEAPFFLEVGIREVHRPYNELEQIPVREEDICSVPFLQDTLGLRMELAMFYENIRRMDESAGEILTTLESQGLADNTLVIFTTDHGIAFPRAKATLYDPGIRTTLLMRWPDGIEGGRTIPALVSNVDLFATLAEIAGQAPSEDCNGKSFLPLLKGVATEGRELIFAEKNTSPDDIKRCVRTATHKYIRNYSEGPLLDLPADIEPSPTRRDMGDDHLAPRPKVELYDLKKDPWEQTNLAGSEDYKAIEDDLAARLDRILAETNDPVLEGPITRPEGEAAIFAHIRNPGVVAENARSAAELLEEYERVRGAELET